MVDNKQFLGGKPIRIANALREELEAAIQAHLTAVEKLTAVLDKADGDPYLEPNFGCEPFNRTGIDELEQDAGDEAEYTWRETHGGGGNGDTARDEEAEPSLAHTNDINQETARKHLVGDTYAGVCAQQDAELEQEHDGREPDDDREPIDGREPSLGATNPDPDRSQAGWAEHGCEDHFIESAADEVMS